MNERKNVSARQVAAHRAEGKAAQIIDVRSQSEFDSGHLPGAIHIPMEALPSRLGDLDLAQPTILVCHSGTRAGMACQQIGHHFQDIAVLEGGTKGWMELGEPVIKTTRSGKPIMQQSLIAAGLMNVLGLALAAFVNPFWLGLSAFVSLGLIVAGSTGFCLMAVILGKMPWNRAAKPATLACTQGS